jgi:hypothetical protein
LFSKDLIIISFLGNFPVIPKVDLTKIAKIKPVPTGSMVDVITGIMTLLSVLSISR